jgi:uncharacterized protein YbbC (DUF1343 family)
VNGHLGDSKAWDMLTKEKKSPEDVLKAFQPRMDEFMKLRKKCLLY